MEPYLIDSREELILALQEATQIEHGLMAQYLFAAFSLKQDESEGLTWDEAELVRGWKGDLLRIARDEMGHLGTVFNMLSAVGGVPEMRRPNFPHPQGRWFPFGFELARLDEATLQRFIRFEEPRPKLKAHGVLFSLPQEPVYEYVGELYRCIRAGFERLGGDQSFFVGDPSIQDSGTWQRLNFPPRPIVAPGAAEAAIDALVEQGEGNGSDPQAHYLTFRRIAKEMADAKASNPAFEPARPVIPNPSLRLHAEAGPGATLIDETTPEGRVCAIFCSYYATLLQGFHAYYGGAALSAAGRIELRHALYTSMSGILRPLAEIITRMTITGDPAGRTMGPSFEIISPVVLPSQGPAKWIVWSERLDLAGAEMRSLADELPQYPRLAALVPSADALAAIGHQLRNIT